MIFYQLLVRLPGSDPHPIEVVVPWTGSKALDDNDLDNDNWNENYNDNDNVNDNDNDNEAALQFHV